MTIQASPLTKQYTHQLIDQFPSNRLPEISLFLEQLLKVVNGDSVNQASLSSSSPPEHPWLKFAGMFKDDPNWDEFQAAIAEYRREVDAREGYEQ
ncbi:MAG: hypothetical protein VSS75_021730 [Candidatus Parabeggiatoa sp.]|nr:hypothetical protein [Candidatus Parabeggiatoa sp.]